MSTFIGAGNTLLDNYTLPVSGTYAIVIDPQTDDIGQMTVTLYDSTDVTGTITVGGSAVTITTTVPGQNGRLTFDGTNGQVVSLNVTGGTYPVAYVSILNPDGTTLAAPASLGTGGGFFDAMTLSQTGTYTIFINPSYEYTGNMTMALYNVTDVSGTITVGGSSVNVTLSVPGQNAGLTFSGTLNQQVTVHVTNSTINCGRVSLLKPDGSELTGVNGCAGSFNLATQTLPVAGTYKVFVNPSQAATGSLTVSVTSP
jgi:hypothetical protein